VALQLTDTPGFEPLSTERLSLRPLRPDDAEEIHRLVNDWEVVRMLSQLPFPYPRDLAGKWIASTLEQMERGSGYHLAITGQEDGKEMLIGCIGLRLDLKPRVGNLGYWIGRRFWRLGVASEAAARLARWALANLDIDHLEASVAVDNPASTAVLRRAGFRETGTGESNFLARGGKHPVTLFEATRDDLFDAPILETSTDPARKLVLVAACALIDTDGRILLTRRPEGKAMAGLWEFPGGKLEPGESPEEAVIRELQEELGIDIASNCLAAFAFASHQYAKFNLLMPLFLCRRWTGRPQGREGQTLAWVRPDKLADYPMPAADKPLIPLLRDFL
jgi:8-oxo-dGTP diphosphatase